MLYIGAGHGAELLLALVVEFEINHRLAARLDAAKRLGHVLARHLYLALHHDLAANVLALRILLQFRQDLVVERILIRQLVAVGGIGRENFRGVFGHQLKFEFGHL
jgi:hypothetical protein